jgi:hypothetical protein
MRDDIALTALPASLDAMQLSMGGGCDCARRDVWLCGQVKERVLLSGNTCPSSSAFGVPTCGIFSMSYGLQAPLDCETLQLDEIRCPLQVSIKIHVQSSHIPPALSLTENRLSQPNSRDVSFSGMRRLRVQA